MTGVQQIQKTEIGILPTDWSLTEIGEHIGDLVAGVSVRSSEHTSFGNESGACVLKTSAVFGGSLDIGEKKPILSADMNRARTPLRKNSFLVSRMNTPALVGECAYCDVDAPDTFLPDRLWQACAKPNSEISIRWLNYLVSSSWIGLRVKERATGTSGSMKNLAKDAFRSTKIPWPSPPEQKAIAQALSDMDDLIASLDALIAKKRDIKQGAMQQLLTGKRRLPGFSGEWVIGQVGDLSICLRGVSYKGDTDLRESETTSTRTLLRSNNVYDGKLVFTDVQHVACERVKFSQLLQKDDILLCMANGSKSLVGKSALFDRTCPNLTFGAFMGCLRPHQKQDGSFLHFLFQTEKYRMQISDVLSGSSINNLAPKQIEGLTFPFPDFEERVAITECLQSFEFDEAAHQNTRNKLKSMRQGMMQQLLTGRIRLI